MKTMVELLSTENYLNAVILSPLSVPVLPASTAQIQVPFASIFAIKTSFESPPSGAFNVKVLWVVLELKKVMAPV